MKLLNQTNHWVTFDKLLIYFGMQVESYFDIESQREWRKWKKKEDIRGWGEIVNRKIDKDRKKSDIK